MEDKFLKVAKQAALEAGKIIQKYSGKIHQKNIKFGDLSDFATEADLDAEKIIISLLSKNFPDHNIITEEQENIQKGSEYTWVIDPLDGTFSFSHGIPFFAVSIGLLKDKELLLGVAYHVYFKDLYWAQKGAGAYLNGNPIHVSKGGTLANSALAIGFGSRKQRSAKYNAFIKFLIGQVGYPYALASPVISLVFVANGLLDSFVNQVFVWDVLAGGIIVREAGGMVTDFEGQEPDWTSERLNIVASNGLIHNQILEALKQ